MTKTRLSLGAVLMGGLCIACGKSGATSDGAAGSGGTTIGAAGAGGAAGGAGGELDAAAGAGGYGEAGDAMAAADGSDAIFATDGAADSAADAETDAAEVAVTPIHPSQLPGLVLWLEAGTLSSSMPLPFIVPVWKDQTANGNDFIATAVDTVSCADVMPEGYRVVQFVDGATSTTMGGPSPSLGLGTGDFLFEMVALFDSTPASWPLFHLNALDVSVVPGGHVVASLGTNASALISTATPGDGETFHLIGLRRVGAGAETSLELRIDGVVDVSRSGAALAQDLLSTGTAGFGPEDVMQVAEAVVIKGASTADEVAGLESYLRSKYPP